MQVQTSEGHARYQSHSFGQERPDWSRIHPLGLEEAVCLDPGGAMAQIQLQGFVFSGREMPQRIQATSGIDREYLLEASGQ